MSCPDLAKIHFGIGVMSKNTVDACLQFANSESQPLLLIPSRRQVEWDGGYANGWTTETLTEYVRTHSNLVVLERDHGGPLQGREADPGALSLEYDCENFDLIHIDPWKVQSSTPFTDGCCNTARYIHLCHSFDPNVRFEIGTEEAIFAYSPEQFAQLLAYLRNHLTPVQFSKIAYAVIQPGTSLWENENTGSFDAVRRDEMLRVCERYGVLSKIHNGDYLPATLIRDHIAAGVSAINIAPEFGRIESECYLHDLPEEAVYLFADLCFRSGQWSKWMTEERAKEPDRLIRVCGHYVLSHPEFLTKVRPAAGKDIDLIVQQRMIERLRELHTYACPKTFFVDLDGTLIVHENPALSACPHYEMKVLPGTLQKLKEWRSRGHTVVITTGRAEYKRAATEVQLKRAGIEYDQLVMGIGRGMRFLVNDRKPDGAATTAFFNPQRNVGIGDIAA